MRSSIDIYMPIASASLPGATKIGVIAKGPRSTSFFPGR